MKQQLHTRKTTLLAKLHYAANDNAIRRISREIMCINEQMKELS